MVTPWKRARRRPVIGCASSGASIAGPVATAAAFAGLVLAGAGISIALAVRATRAERATRHERNRAVAAEAEAKAEGEKSRRSAEEAEAVLKFFQEQVLAAARPEGQEGGLGRDVTIREAVDAADAEGRRGVQGSTGGRGIHPGRLGVRPIFCRASRARRSPSSSVPHPALRGSTGPDHPDDLTARNSLAKAYHAAGRTAEALKLCSRRL